MVAALASAGAALTVIAQSRIAERNRREDIESGFWKRYDDAARQLSNPNLGFAVRAAGVYALGGLANDWIRHHDRLGQQRGIDRDANSECATIIDLLCAQLRRNTHLDEKLQTDQVHEEQLINEAIIGRFITELQRPQHNKMASKAGKNGGMWVGRTQLDLRGSDLTSVRMTNLALREAVLRDADLYDADLSGSDLTEADLRGADVRDAWFRSEDGQVVADLTGAQLDGVMFNNKTRWPNDATRAKAKSVGYQIPDHAFSGKKVDQLRMPIPRLRIGRKAGKSVAPESSR